MKKAVVLLSGGLDSATCLSYALSKGYQCYGLGFDYGQLHSIELRQAEQIAKHLKVSWRSIKLDLSYLNTPLLQADLPCPEVTSAQELLDSKAPSPFTVPGRNTIFFAHAMSYACNVGAKTLVMGFNRNDHAFCDCSSVFVQQLQKLTHVAIDTGPMEILTPLMSLGKEEIIQLALQLHVPINLTLSCYRPADLHPCQKCHACILRRDAFQSLGLLDPAR